MSPSLTALALLEAGDCEAAIAELLDYTRLHLGCARGLALRARAFEHAGCLEEARRDFRALRELGVDHRDVRKAERRVSRVSRALERNATDCRRLRRIGVFAARRCRRPARSLNGLRTGSPNGRTRRFTATRRCVTTPGVSARCTTRGNGSTRYAAGYSAIPRSARGCCTRRCRRRPTRCATRAWYLPTCCRGSS